MITLIAQVIPHFQQRYETIGDWQRVGREGLIVTTSELGDWKMDALVQFHEWVEALICKATGVSEAEVDQFDLNYRGEGEPGDEITAPYYGAHQLAEELEKQFAVYLGVNWDLYLKRIEEVGNGRSLQTT